MVTYVSAPLLSLALAVVAAGDFTQPAGSGARFAQALSVVLLLDLVSAIQNLGRATFYRGRRELLEVRILGATHNRLASNGPLLDLRTIGSGDVFVLLAAVGAVQALAVVAYWAPTGPLVFEALDVAAVVLALSVALSLLPLATTPGGRFLALALCLRGGHRGAASRFVSNIGAGMAVLLLLGLLLVNPDSVLVRWMVSSVAVVELFARATMNKTGQGVLVGEPAAPKVPGESPPGRTRTCS